MFGMWGKSEDTFKRVEQAVERASFKNLGHAAASIRKTAQASIVKAPKAKTAGRTNQVKRDARGRFLKGSGKKRRGRQLTVPSKPGQPPHTRRGQLKRAIKYHATKDSAVIGPEGSKVGTSSEAHEFGKRYKGTKYPARPFMGPARDANSSRFASAFAGSIGS